MVGKFVKAIVWALVLTLVSTSVVYAEDDLDLERIQCVGEIQGVNPDSNSFILLTRTGENFEFIVTEHTNFRSRIGAMGSIDVLSIGMKTLVTGTKDSEGNLIASLVVAGQASEMPELLRASGTIVSINPDEGSFQLEMINSEIQEFTVGYRTRYISRDGSINGLVDIAPGMSANVVAVIRGERSPLALRITVGGYPEQRERFKVIGDITNVIPGQETFELEDRNGNMVTFIVNERTRFRSRDGSIEDIHDLKKGMRALVVGLRDGDGPLVALGVAAGYPEDLRVLSGSNFRALGKIISLDNQSFTIESRNRGDLTFLVDDTTIYKSRDGSLDEFNDLQVGMISAVVAEKFVDGGLKAIMIATGP